MLQINRSRFLTSRYFLPAFGTLVVVCFILGILRLGWMIGANYHPPVTAWIPSPAKTETATEDTSESLHLRADSILILFWTEYFSQPFTPTSEHRKDAQHALNNCPFTNCVLTNQRRLVNRSSAVIFHIRELADRPDKSVPLHRSPNQYYVFYLQEAPPHTGMLLDQFEDFFNLTFTYRLDSDIPSDIYWRRYSPTLWKDASDFEKAWSKKTHFAAIFVSYCDTPSLREVYIEELARYIPLNIFGSCGDKECNKTIENCDEKISTYKFYLAFENSVCEDYVTEKIHRAYNQNAVPVVYGGANYSRMFPPNSYINILDYSSPKHLAEHLLKVANNKVWYSQYFQWKYKRKFLTLPKHLQSPQSGWCKLCMLLNFPTETPSRKVYSSLGQWWFDDAKCVLPTVETVNGNQS